MLNVQLYLRLKEYSQYTIDCFSYPKTAFYGERNEWPCPLGLRAKLKSYYIIKQSYDYVHSISPPFLNKKTESHHSRGSSEHRDDGIKVHFLIFFMGILFQEFCPILEDFSWAMANTVINNNLSKGPTQSCSCVALYCISSHRYQRSAAWIALLNKS